ncbi:MAG: isocitrate/isopropylmalate family dehydrogenase, partial [Candidatus Bathyarchaeia archaeon]
MGKKIAIIRGDGIGPEVMNASIRLLGELDLNLEFVECEAGYETWKNRHVALSEDTLDQMQHTDACLKGPTQTIPGPNSFASVIVALRQRFGLFANLRPIKSRKGVPALYSDVDCMLIRENTEGLYSGLEAKLDDLSFAL